MHEDAESLLVNRQSPRWQNYLAVAGKRRFIIAVSLAVLVSLFGLSVFRSSWSNEHTIIPVAEDVVEKVIPPSTPLNSSALVDHLGPADNLLGLPTANFRDNLRDDRKYITSWVSAGWTNDVMTYINLIYLAIITDRIPVLPMFTPSHIGGAVPPIDFGLVFDVPRLRKALHIPVLEWHEVKDRKSESIDELGCWNTWEAVQKGEHYPRRSPVPDHLKLDISYTKAPSWIKVIPYFDHDMHSYFWSLAALAFPETRTASLVPPLESPNHHVLLPPDEQMLCYDYLYYVCANQPYEMEFDYSPAWRFVGQYLYWSPKIEQLAYQYVRRAVGTTEDQPTPPANTTGCYASLDVIARRVDEVKDELLQRKGISVQHVIMTSDERNTTWWDEVKSKGWYGVDHSQTADLMGPWYPVLIDAAIQSLGAGFVGTDRSTMSMLARRRVESWADGAARIFKWGKPDSDDH
ncbi:hypothetical protein DXG01_009928 [Tephrocybe rancida]|nr:hypothetical protein DXG01_009928 [Tephrocybe rancida]